MGKQRAPVNPSPTPGHRIRPRTENVGEFDVFITWEADKPLFAWRAGEDRFRFDIPRLVENWYSAWQLHHTGGQMTLGPVFLRGRVACTAKGLTELELRQVEDAVGNVLTQLTKEPGEAEEPVGGRGDQYVRGILSCQRGTDQFARSNILPASDRDRFLQEFHADLDCPTSLDEFDVQAWGRLIVARVYDRLRSEDSPVDWPTNEESGTIQSLVDKPESSSAELRVTSERSKEPAKPSLPEAIAIISETLRRQAHFLAEHSAAGENEVERAEQKLHPLREAIAGYFQQLIRAAKLIPRPPLEEGRKEAARLNDQLAGFGLRFRLRPGEETPATLSYVPTGGTVTPGTYLLQASVRGKPKKAYLRINRKTGWLDLSTVEIMLAPRTPPGPRPQAQPALRTKR